MKSFTLPSFRELGGEPSDQDLAEEVEFIRLSQEAHAESSRGRPDLASESLSRARGVRDRVRLRLNEEAAQNGHRCEGEA